MRSFIIACALVCSVPTANAAIIKYNISDNFAVRQTSPGGVNQPAPLGGLLDGFIEVDTSQVDDAVIVDYSLTSFLPNFLNNPAPAVDYIFAGPGDSFSFVSATGLLSIVSDVPGSFIDNPIVSSRSSLSLTLGALGGNSLAISGSETFINCTAFFTVFGLQNPCQGIQGSNGGLQTLASIDLDGGQGGGDNGGGDGGQGGGGTIDVPAPASAPLLMTGLLALGVLRRKTKST